MEAEADPEVRAIVLTGAGRAFSSGYDIGGDSPPTVWPYGLPEGMSVAAFLDDWRTRGSDENKKLLQIWELTKPVIAAVNGWCMGGGSWYALTCHMTYASDKAVFSQPEINLQVATMGLEMMGLRNALTLNTELGALAQTSQREDFRKYLDDAQETGGMRGFLQTRDGPFQPEPFGPRSKVREE